MRTSLPALALCPQQIEETLKRIALQKGVEGYIIADESGALLRTTFTDEPDRDMVAKLSQDLPALASRASSAVRDLDPTVRVCPFSRPRLTACAAHARASCEAHTCGSATNPGVSYHRRTYAACVCCSNGLAERDAVCARADQEEGDHDLQRCAQQGALLVAHGVALRSRRLLASFALTSVRPHASAPAQILAS
jgi:hypothetical protein